MKIDKEADRFSGALLIEVANLNPHLSKQLTKRVERNAAIKNDKKLRKVAKVAILVKEHPELYEEAAKRLRSKPEFSSPASNPKISMFYENIYQLFSADPVPGSIESKYDYGQGPIED